jgi:glycosyltransferase involved in cell wall biosynthesis
MKKVLHVISSMSVGGIESLVVELYKNIDRTKFQFEFAVMNPVNPVNASAVQQLGAVVHYISNATVKRGVIHKILWRILALINYWRLISKTKYDVVHCHVYERFSWYIIMAYLKRIPIRIVHCHNSGSEANNFIFALNQLVRKILSPLVTYKISCSKIAGEWFWGANNIRDFEVIYNGIDLEKFNRVSYTDDAIAKPSGIDITKKIKIVNVGRFSKQKNQTFLIEVFSHLINKRTNVELNLVGFGSMENEIRQKVSEYKLEGDVYFYPPDTDIPKLFSVMDYFILPSLWEGFGIVVIEAQAMELPCIVSDAISEEIDCGLCYYLPLESNAEEWANKIDEILNVNTAGKVCRQKIERFNIKYVAKQFEEIYNQKIK